MFPIFVIHSKKTFVGEYHSLHFYVLPSFCGSYGYLYAIGLVECVYINIMDVKLKYL
jgi:hypothetical protein